jgi:spore coat protein CotF
MAMDVRTMLTDLTSSEKHLAQAYCMAQLESANRQVRDTLARLQQRVQEQHAQFFHEMHQRGWYQTPVAGQQDIESAVIQWEQKFEREPDLSQKSKH